MSEKRLSPYDLAKNLELLFAYNGKRELAAKIIGEQQMLLEEEITGRFSHKIIAACNVIKFTRRHCFDDAELTQALKEWEQACENHNWQAVQRKSNVQKL